MVKSIIIMRHAERIDRAEEAAGRDWISTAPRPQDPVLSPIGMNNLSIPCHTMPSHSCISVRRYYIPLLLMSIDRKKTSFNCRRKIKIIWNNKDLSISYDPMRDHCRLDC